MYKKIGNKVLWIFYIAVIGLFLYLNVYNKEKREIFSVNTYVSIVMLVIVGGVIFYSWLKCLRVGDSIILDLKTIVNQIPDSTLSSKSFLWEEYKEKEVLFKTPELQKAYKNYRCEMLRLEDNATEGYKCDIEDFINYDLVDSAINKSFLNLIPGVMTGLGILGTFVGLSFGLQNFNTGTAEEISDSIAPLMNGIKVAFHTSIYGMVMSLIFNFIYKKKLENAYKSIDEFVFLWRRRITPDAGNEGMSKLLQYQENQAGDMNDIEKVAQMLAGILNPQYQKINEITEKILEKTSTFGEEVARTLNEALTPEFNMLNRTISNFAEVAAKTQVDGMNQMVDTFMDRLSESLSYRFTKLAKVIDDTCEMQKDNSIFLKETLEWISTTVKDIEAINSGSQKTVIAMQEYLEKLAILQTKINEDIRLFDIQMQKNSEIIDKTELYQEKLKDYIKNIVGVTSLFGKQMQNQEEYLQEISKTIADSVQKNLELISQKANEQIELSAQTAEKYTKAISDEVMKDIYDVSSVTKQQMDKLISFTEKAADRIVKQAIFVTDTIEDKAESGIESVSKVQKEAVEQNKNMVESMLHQVNSYTEGTQNHLKDFSEKLSQELINYTLTISKELKNSTEQMRTDIIKIVESINNEISGTLNSIREMERVIQSNNTESIEKLNKRIEECITTMTTTVKSQIQQIEDYKNHTNVDLNKATKQLYDAAMKLDMGIQENLEKTFDSFDKNLATITTHLSGTIAEVDNTTKRVPSVVNASYEGMEKGLKQMEENMEKLVQELNNLVFQLSKRQSDIQ